MNEKIMVSISCITYNHAPYIRQCLDGFIMQKTNFAFEVLIHDDASTDGTTEIIKEYETKYPDIIKPIYEEENQWVKGCRGSAVFNFPRAKGKYIAMCEGDDYWIDPLKLQKQVDFLEGNPKFGLVYTKAKKELDGKTIAIIGRPTPNFEVILDGNTIATLTVMLRANLLHEYYKEVNPSQHNWQMGDYPMWLWFTLKSKLHFMDEITAAYRVLAESASHSKNINKMISFVDGIYNIKCFFIDRFKNNDRQLRKKALDKKNWSLFNLHLLNLSENQSINFYDTHFRSLSIKHIVVGFLITRIKPVGIHYKKRLNK